MASSIDQIINQFATPIAKTLSDFIFSEITIGNISFPWIVMWLILAALFFTCYLKFINIRGFTHAVRLVKGDFSKDDHHGEISHFQALTTAVSGTVGIGNIGGVAVVITLGGPGAMFWLIVAGFLGMATKFAECIVGVKYRITNPDGSVSGGPMYYLEQGLKARGMGLIAKPLGVFYALAIVIGCLGIGNMFQSNQAFEQIVFITGGAEQSIFADKGWLIGLIIAFAVAVVVIGGVKQIARVTSRLVPFMALLYVTFGVLIILINYDKVPAAVASVFSEAFSPRAGVGGVIGVMILGFRRAAFSNEAGIGSAAIAHSAVKTNEPVTEGYVALLEPFIDTVVICSITALVILTTIYDPTMSTDNIKGVELTSTAFASTIGWSVYPLSIAAVLFAFSTIIAWSYYGMKGWTYLVGHSKQKQLAFNMVYCLFAIVGCTVQLGAILDISDALIFIVAVPNVLGLYLLAPIIKREVEKYQQKYLAK